ncbi:MAG: hypothetical protein FWH40_06475 [Coriobacteriia bacterium]|nr:hypothetical protein [Coriobacteriia bacterium]
MGKLTCYEALKLLQRRTAWLVVAGLLCANCLLVYYQANRQGPEGYSLRQASEVYSELALVDPYELVDWMRADTERIYSDAFAGSYEGLYRAHIYQSAEAQLGSVLAYGQYLEGIDTQAERMMTSSVFAEPGTFSYRNIQQTPKAYAGLKGLEVPFAFSGGVLLVSDNRLVDLPLFASLLVLAMHLLISEREEGTLAIVKSAKHGHGKTIAAKALVLLGMTAALTLAFYGLTLLVALSQVGLGDLSRPVQSLQGYLSSPLRLSVLQFLLLFLSAKLLAGFAVMAAFFAACVYARNSVYACMAAVLAFGVQALMYKQIGAYSPYSLLAYVNLAAVLDTGAYFADYVNLNLFGYPLNTVASGLAAAAAATSLGLGFGCYQFANEETASAQESRVLVLARRLAGSILPKAGFGRHRVLALHEAYKLLAMNKGLLVYAVLVLIQIMYFNGLRLWVDREEYYYLQYSVRLEGGLTPEKRDYLVQEAYRIESVEADERSIYEQYERGEIDIAYMDYLIRRLEVSPEQRSAFGRAYSQYFMLEAQAQSGREVAYVYQTAWVAVLGPAARGDALGSLAKALLALVVGLSSLGSVEKTTRMDALITASARGRPAVTRLKTVLCCCFALLACLTAMLPKIAKVFLTYGFKPSDLLVSASSLTAIAGAPANMPIALYFAGRLVACLAYCTLAGLAVFKVSERTGNTITTMLACTAVFVLPVVALMLLGA